MSTAPGSLIGTVVGNTSPDQFTFILKSFGAKLGDLVCVGMQIPGDDHERPRDVLVWGRIVELARFNPFLPAEAGQELADEGVGLLQTVLSVSRDQVEGKVLVLGRTLATDLQSLRPLNYPVSPGAEVRLPPAETVRTILTGDEETQRIRLGTLIGRSDVEVKLKSNALVARHMAILAMTGGGKTVAARRVIRELLTAGYPLVILDPHGDYLGFWSRRDLFPDRTIKLYYPHLSVREETRDLIGYLVSEMTQGFTEAQKEVYHDAIEAIAIPKEGMEIPTFLDELIGKLTRNQDHFKGHKGTIPAVKRGLRIVRDLLIAMQKSNDRLRHLPGLKDFPFEALPDPKLKPEAFVRPGQASIIYLGGYDHLTQATIVSLVLKQLFEHRASMSNRIAPFLAVVEEAHNFIPSRGEGQQGTPSVEVIRKIITEGRKFGTGLLLISQRPSRLDETTLSQCNTFLIFRLVNPRDQSFVEKVMENLSKADSRLLPAFGPGQGIVSGQAVRFPLVIQVDNDDELITPSIGNEDFIKAAADWASSEEAHTVAQSDEVESKIFGE